MYDFLTYIVHDFLTYIVHDFLTYIVYDFLTYIVYDFLTYIVYDFLTYIVYDFLTYIVYDFEHWNKAVIEGIRPKKGILQNNCFTKYQTDRAVIIYEKYKCMSSTNGPTICNFTKYSTPSQLLFMCF